MLTILHQYCLHTKHTYASNIHITHITIVCEALRCEQRSTDHNILQVLDYFNFPQLGTKYRLIKINQKTQQ